LIREVNRCSIVSLNLIRCAVIDSIETDVRIFSFFFFFIQLRSGDAPAAGFSHQRFSPHLSQHSMVGRSCDTQEKMNKKKKLKWEEERK
jgi:hypothetical protein